MVFDKVMAISRFFQEKTIFENYFKQHLANKLLLDESVSHDIKVDILSKLKVGNCIIYLNFKSTYS